MNIYLKVEHKFCQKKRIQEYESVILNEIGKTRILKTLKTAIFRKEHFNAAHRLFNPNWSDAENDNIFGKCNNPNYHGHNYELIVKLIGDIDPVTGYVYDTKLLSDLIKEHILKRYDHKNLNLDCEEFKNRNPTAENIAQQIYITLRALIEPSIDLKVILYETERNFVEYPA